MVWFCADIETTYLQEEDTSVVWSVRVINGLSGQIYRFSYLSDFIEWTLKLKEKSLIYIHNLKFDGNFFLNYFFFDKRFKQAWNSQKKEFRKNKNMTPYEYKYLISEKGLWYNITLKNPYTTVIFLDSLKLAPLSLAECAEAFKTEHKKLDMNYSEIRLPGYQPTPDEESYIDSDVLIMKEFLELMFEEGADSPTIGGVCMKQFKKTVDDFNAEFPNLYEMEIDEKLYGAPSIGDYILKSYFGAFIYVNPAIQGDVVGRGKTYDVNSLYPYVMHSKSGNRYFYGRPWMVKNPTREQLKNAGGNKDYFVRFTCGFELKENKIPFIHIRRSMLYPARKVLATSRIELDGVLRDDLDGIPIRPEFTMSREEFEFFNETYELRDLKILDYCFCYTRERIFDNYIDFYGNLKMSSIGGRRFIYKLYLNNLYGKFSTTTDSSFKIIYEKEPGKIGFKIVQEKKKKPGYIANGSKIISNARLYILKYANLCYSPGEKTGFAYCDTDSLHIIGDLSVNLPVDDKELGKFKCEGEWRRAVFIRAKSYMEDVKQSDGSYKSTIICAGATKRNKELFRMSMGEIPSLAETPEEVEFLRTRRTYLDFRPGLKIPSKLRPVQVKGGVHLFHTYFTMQSA